MRLSRLSAVVLALVLVRVPQAMAQQQPSMPANVDAGLFAADVRALLRVSDTFRAQCERIAADPRVRVRVSIAYSVASGGRAQTTFRRYRSGALFADVEIVFGESYRELLAHEFEHVIEQLDGLDLRAEAAQGRAWVVGDGAFETRRAIAVGLAVSSETDRATPAAIPTRLR